MSCDPKKDQCGYGRTCTTEGCVDVRGSIANGEPCAKDEHCASFKCQSMPSHAAELVGIPSDRIPRVCVRNGDAVLDPADFARR